LTHYLRINCHEADNLTGGMVERIRYNTTMNDQRCNEHIIESHYPISFRKKDTEALTQTIKRHESVCLVAMKKVGISTFVRHYFYNNELKKQQFGDDTDRYLFIYCDCNDLLEVTDRAFWILLLTRCAEGLAGSCANQKVKKEGDKLFLRALSAKDSFIYFDSLRKIAELISANTDLYVTFFLLRFDRLQPIFDKNIGNNLYALIDKVKGRLSYITTSVRPLNEIAPNTFSQNLPIFVRSQYIAPASLRDMKSIQNYLNLVPTYCPKLTGTLQKTIIEIGSGHITISRIIVIVISEWNDIPEKKSEIMHKLLRDERINMACEEIWENLIHEERYLIQDILTKKRPQIPATESFLLKSGVLIVNNGIVSLFSPLFKQWVAKKIESFTSNGIHDLTKKEELLLNLLQSKNIEICRREEIIEQVWPEYQNSEDLAVSDWAIDRLVSRLRKKIKMIDTYQSWRIVTLRSRGYRLLR